MKARRVTRSSMDTSVCQTYCDVTAIWQISSANFLEMSHYPSTREFRSALTAISVVLDDNLSYKGNLYNHDSGPLMQAGASCHQVTL